MKKLLKKIVKLQEFAAKRGEELLHARGNENEMWVDKFEFNKNEITITFQEKTDYDCPDYYEIDLNNKLLNMCDSDWNLYIENERKMTSKKNEERKRKEIENQLIEDQEQYIKLKRKLGL